MSPFGLRYALVHPGAGQRCVFSRAGRCRGVRCTPGAVGELGGEEEEGAESGEEGWGAVVVVVDGGMCGREVVVGGGMCGREVLSEGVVSEVLSEVLSEEALSDG